MPAISEAKEVVQLDECLNILRIGIRLDPIRRHEYDMNGLMRARLFLEFGLLVADGFVNVPFDRIKPVMVLHFAQIDDSVIAVNQEIDLRLRIMPGMDVGMDAANKSFRSF